MVLMRHALVVLCCVSLVPVCSGEDSGFTKKDFDEAIRGESTFAVYYYGKQNPTKETLEKVQNSIQMSTVALTKNSLKMIAINCDFHKDLPDCKDSSKFHTAVLYKEAKIQSVISGENLLTPAEVTINVLHNDLLPASDVPELTSTTELEAFKEKNRGKQNVFVFYIPYRGSKEHLDALTVAKILPSHVNIAYTLKKDLCGDDNVAWFINTLTPKDGDSEMLVSQNVQCEKFLKLIAEACAVETLLPGDQFFEHVEEQLASNDDILILIAGKKVRRGAFEIARAVATERRGLKVTVVDSTTTFHTHIQPRVRDGRIFAMVAKRGEENPSVIDIGYVKEDEVRTILDQYDEARSEQDSIWSELQSDQSTDFDDSYFPYPENVLDDPMTFSLHHSGNVKTLYYFDYKTLPRLTDKTYQEVINGRDFAVILFTLEFNPRAIAALVTFAEIHKAYKESGQMSPMYRVECYNWPDVCEDAGVYTSPRLFFYPKGDKERIEYSGLWDKVSIKDAILRYSNPEVIVIRKKEDILPYNPMTSRSVVGFFENDEGTEEFRKAAKIVRKDYQFIEVHGDVRDMIAENYELEYQHKTIVGFDNGFPLEKVGTFSTADDILNFLKIAFQTHKLQELSIYSFAEVMKNPKPFLIYFWDQTNGNEKFENDLLKDMLQDMSGHESLKNRMLFTWMDSSTGSVGEFVLKQYNRKVQVQGSTVAFFDKKGSVILKSCQACNNETLMKWLEDCLDGKVETSYGLNTEEWKPRLEGFDYLEFMKQEGTYPTSHKLMQKLVEEGKVGIPGHRGGRTIRAMNKVPKMEQDEMVVKQSPVHQEL